MDLLADAYLVVAVDLLADVDQVAVLDPPENVDPTVDEGRQTNASQASGEGPTVSSDQEAIGDRAAAVAAPSSCAGQGEVGDAGLAEEACDGGQGRAAAV